MDLCLSIVPRISELLQIEACTVCTPRIVSADHDLQSFLEHLLCKHHLHINSCFARLLSFEVLERVNVVTTTDEVQPVLHQRPTGFRFPDGRHFPDQQIWERTMRLPMTERQRWAVHDEFELHSIALDLLGDVVCIVDLLLHLLHLGEETAEHQIMFIIATTILSKLAIELHRTTDHLRDGGPFLAHDIGHTVQVLFQLIFNREKLPCHGFWEISCQSPDAEPNLLARSEGETISVFQLYWFTLHQAGIQAHLDMGRICMVMRCTLLSWLIFLNGTLQLLRSVLSNHLRRVLYAHEFCKDQRSTPTHSRLLLAFLNLFHPQPDFVALFPD
mmetsp:Transcript_45321/g.120196  ORF Transcript_45321/g.120196 Transcript_45321/m.120196 type:complete len:330 (-) Transcript_45321:1674-2663(-)